MLQVGHVHSVNLDQLREVADYVRIAQLATVTPLQVLELVSLVLLAGAVKREVYA